MIVAAQESIDHFLLKLLIHKVYQKYFKIHIVYQNSYINKNNSIFVYRCSFLTC